RRTSLLVLDPPERTGLGERPVTGGRAAVHADRGRAGLPFPSRWPLLRGLFRRVGLRLLEFSEFPFSGEQHTDPFRPPRHIVLAADTDQVDVSTGDAVFGCDAEPDDVG